MAAQQDRRDILLEIAGFVVILAGLAILARGVWDASPIVFWHTDAEAETAREVREIMLGGTAVLVAAALPLAVRGRHLRALAAVAPAAICTPLAYETDPGTGWAVWLFLPLPNWSRSSGPVQGLPRGLARG